MILGGVIALSAVLDGYEVGGLLGGGIVALLGAASLLFGLQNRLAKMKIGEIQIEIPQRRVRAGETIDVFLTIPPASKARLNQVTALLTATEVVVSGTDTNRSLHTHPVFGDPAPHIFDGSVDRVLAKGESLRLSHRFSLPYDAPPSFHAEDNDLDWLLEFHVDIARWPDWKKRIPIEVLPADPGELKGPSAGDGHSPTPTEELLEGPRW